MVENVVEIQSLTKVYRSLASKGTRAISELSFSVPKGSFFGVLGPNGSGKTTTFRCLLGLARPSSGTSSLFGREVPHDLPEVIHRVGCLIEQPRFSPGFSGRLNLILLAKHGGVPDGRISELLERVDLGAAADKPYGKYSLGMKQRLGLAAALLKDPDLLILDEPTNGLDPIGILETRELLVSLSKEGKTIVMASHVLSEVDKVCDSVIILSKGKAVADGRLSDILGDSASRYYLRTVDTEIALRVLNNAGYAAFLEGDEIRIENVRDPTHLTRALSDGGIDILELVRRRESLEVLYSRLIGRSNQT